MVGLEGIGHLAGRIGCEVVCLTVNGTEELGVGGHLWWSDVWLRGER